MQVQSTALLAAATTTETGEAKRLNCAFPTFSFHAYGETTNSTGAATILIEGSNVEAPASNADWFTIDTLALTLGTTRTSDWGYSTVPFRNVRARVSAISGTGASVSVRLAG